MLIVINLTILVLLLLSIYFLMRVSKDKVRPASKNKKGIQKRTKT